MTRILILKNNSDGVEELDSALRQMGYYCSTAYSADMAIDMAKREALDVLLVDANSLSASAWYNLKTEQIPKIKSAVHVPVIALLPSGTLDGIHAALQIDDFIVRPFNLSELVARIKRTLNRINTDGNQDSIRSGDLLMDAAKCEVSIKDRLISLTFKEYELLKFLMRHKGKVFTRDALLNEVWGYDYYGGDRTVDVHIRRLRSKIEDNNHTYIDTVRNIGYKFCS